ncbi:MAG: TolC family protein, partial [Verrucomicrobia bacterium]|nr:TolC family protein [Verrucomicrobiota bacterium]
LNLRVTQPLLAGAGFAASHESLTQAERDLVYQLRRFALQRQDFVIDVLQRYYQLLNQQRILENTRLNVEQSTYLRERTEALFDVRMAAAIDVMRSQQQELSARNQLEDAQADFEVAVKRFLIAIGLPSDLDLSIVGNLPMAKPITLDEARCIDAALTHRLDLQTARDQATDSRRRLTLAHNTVLPKLDIYAYAGFRAPASDSFGDQRLEDELTAGVVFELPLDRRDEQDALVIANLEADAADRAAMEVNDTVRVEIIENFRRLRSLDITLKIQQQNMTIAQKRARNALLRFKNGELSNRDVVEAENELLTARNSYSQAIVDYELQRLRLLRNIGLLDVSADGTIVEWTLADQQSTTTPTETP